MEQKSPMCLLFDFAGGSWVVTSEGSSVVARRAAEEGCAGCVVA